MKVAGGRLDQGFSEVPRKMLIATAAIKGLTGLGWVSLIAVDSHIVPVGLSTAMHNDILGVLIVASIGIVAHWKSRSKGDRTYPEGVVDGMRLAAANADLPTPRRGHGANVLYLHEARSGSACTQRAPKAGTARSSS